MRAQSDNDRDAGLADRTTTRGPSNVGAAPSSSASVDAALARLRLDGAIFFRSEFTEAWSYESPAAAAEVANMLRPGAERLIIFHIVAGGSCWVSLIDGDRHWAGEGD